MWFITHQPIAQILNIWSGPQLFFTFPVVLFMLFSIFPVGQITFTFELTKWHSPTFLPSKIPSSYTSPQSIICHFLSCHGWSGMTKWVKIKSGVAFFCLVYTIWFFNFHMYFRMHKGQRPSNKSMLRVLPKSIIINIPNISYNWSCFICYVSPKHFIFVWFKPSFGVISPC